MNSQTMRSFEMNQNPAIHIHAYPLIGQGKNVGQAVLKALRFI